MSSTRVIIIGGGISGLAAAHFLSRSGVTPLLLEKSARLGGLVETRQTSYGHLESGPDSFLASKTSVAELAAELGISDRIIGSNDAQRRVFIGRKGQLVAMPPGMVMMAPSDFRAALSSPLFSAGAKLRILRETLFRPKSRLEDVTLERFVLDHFGREVLAVVAEPLLTGVYGGDPATLSVGSVLPRFLQYEKTHGSLIRAVRRERRASSQGSLFQSFSDGMQVLIDALVTALSGRAELRTGSAAVAIEKDGPQWSVRTEPHTFKADHVILATPAHAAASLVPSGEERLASALKAIPYSSAILVTFVYRDSDLRRQPEGFGFLVPRSERLTVAAATFVSTKFPARIVRGHVAARCFIVGAEADEMAHSEDGAITRACQADLLRWTGIAAKPQSVLIQRWPNSMPQYVVGHAARLASIEADLAALPGLHLCGNAYHGVGIPDCVSAAKTVAHRIAGLKT